MHTQKDLTRVWLLLVFLAWLMGYCAGFWCMPDMLDKMEAGNFCLDQVEALGEHVRRLYGP